MPLPPSLNDPTCWRTVKALFEEAVARPPGDRAAFLDEACADDPGLRLAVDVLMEAETEAADFLNDSPLRAFVEQDAATARPDPLLGERIGPYRVAERLAEGGMGVVYRAERADGLFEQAVALKLVKRGMDTDAVLRRFDHERRILARLVHPDIARLYDGGAAPDGRPWLAMEFVEGEPITDYAARHHLGLDERLRLVERVCAAVHHAHRNLVVHRDLKPGNVLVTDAGEGTPRVKLLDFGIAKVLAGDDGDPHTLTAEALRPMTRAYAAPEQLRGEPASTATDVWALGAVLYELLTGRRPFAGEGPAALETAILSTEPIRPSQALRPDGAEPLRINGDLDTLVLKALRKNPVERYDSAAALAADLARYRAGEPILARTPTVGYRMRSFIGRHPAGVGIAALAALFLLVFAVTVTLQQRATARERDAAQATADFLQGLFASADPSAQERQDTLRVRDLLERGLERTRTDLTDQPHVRARLLQVIGQTYLALGMHMKAEGPLEEALAWQRTQNDPARLIAVLTALTSAKSATPDMEGAVRFAREAVALAERERDPALHAQAQRALIEILLYDGQPEEAEARTRAARAEQVALHGPDDPRVLEFDQYLARALADQGKMDEAETTLLALHSAYAEQFGPDHPRMLEATGPLMFIYLATGRLTEADTLGARALTIARNAKTDQSGSYAQMLAIHAAVLRRLGRLGDAEAELREAIAIPPITPGAHAIPFGTLASVLKEKGDLEGAIAAQRESVALLAAMEGSPSEPFGRMKLAGFLRDARRFAEAEAELLVVHRLLVEQGESGGHQTVGSVAAEFVTLYEAWGRADEAARWRVRASG